jgi:methionyl-tRNA formyltransferase
LIQALEQQGPKFLNDTIRNYGKGFITPMKQNEEEATSCQKIEKADGEIDPFHDTLEDLYAKYRAFILRPKVRFTLHEKIVIIETLVLDETQWETHKTQPLFL